MQPSQYRAAPAPIQLNDTARCDGLKSPIHPGKPLGICQDCTRRPAGPLPGSVWWMEPAAKHDGTEWRCSERRSGGVHESDDPRESVGNKPLDMGAPQVASYVRQPTEGKA